MCWREREQRKKWLRGRSVLGALLRVRELIPWSLHVGRGDRKAQNLAAEPLAPTVTGRPAEEIRFQPVEFVYICCDTTSSENHVPGVTAVIKAAVSRRGGNVLTSPRFVEAPTVLLRYYLPSPLFDSATCFIVAPAHIDSAWTAGMSNVQFESIESEKVFFALSMYSLNIRRHCHGL